MASLIGELKSAQSSQKNMPLNGLLGASRIEVGRARNGDWSVGVTSVVWSGVEADEENGVFVYRPRNGKRRWYKPIAQRRI
jgi:hypothetical protein